MRFKAERICWRQFTRKHDAIFRSLGKEMSIGILSVSTLLFATPDTAAAKMAINAESHNATDKSIEEMAETDIDSLIMLEGTEVVASRAPIPADKAVRLVQVINHKEIEASSAQSVNDLLKLSAGVDVRQRGGFGIQTDIGVNGGNSDQLTVLLNGVNITNPHTGHLTVDLPVNVDDIERIEILEGGASRVYGSSAFSGAINIVTRAEKKNSANAHLAAGSYGTWGGNANGTIISKNFNNRVSAGHTESDGNCNNDFIKSNIYWQGAFSSTLLDVKAQAGFSTMNYGANTFYGTGSKTQYEENRRIITSIQAEYKGKVHILPQVYWNRSLDHYVWTRSNPEAYQNFHQTNVYGANINAHTTWALGKTAIGFEYRSENILSTRLGKEIQDGKSYKVPNHDEYYKYKDSRSNYGLYLEHDILLDNLSISLGVLANKNTSVDGGMRLYPGIDVSWEIAEGLRVYGSFNQSLRTPTFTDLYYDGPGLKGYANLKPEKSTDYSVGINYRNRFISAQLKGFYRKGTDMIDWVKVKGENIHTTANSDIDDIGAEALVRLNFANEYGVKSFIQNITFSYCYNYKYRVNEEQAELYVSQLQFLRHKFVTSLNHRIVSHLTAQWDFTLKSRNGEFFNAITETEQKYGTFTNLDMRINWAEPKYDIYVSLNNVLNRKYFDIANVEQPGLWVMGGVKIHL
ncbi:MAG: TonB-dependent receptor [Bacteroidaceae bacterium]|nr:TonB-dependent receptor [Bacteroidaceae bacterium]